MNKRLTASILAILLLLSAVLFSACGFIVDPYDPYETDTPTKAPETEPLPPQTEEETDRPETTPPETTPPAPEIDEDGVYTTKEDVALYIHTYGHLPSNFITKKEAEKKGWNGGSLEKVAPGKCIGGTYFGNYENKLPKKPGRIYNECDIDTLGKRERGEKRIVYSNDGLIYYTDDHYETFTLLYGEGNE